MSIRGLTYHVLVNSGCNHTSKHQSLVQGQALDKEQMWRCGVLTEMCTSIYWCQSQFHFRHSEEVAYLRTVGTNLQGFKTLLKCIFVDRSCSSEAWGKNDAVLAGEAVPGPSMSGKHRGWVVLPLQPLQQSLLGISCWSRPAMSHWHMPLTRWE